MTESEWTTCNNPKAMLAFLASQGKGSDRKLRLFSCGCYRRVWHALTYPHTRKAVEVAERYADGLAGDEEREEALAGVVSIRGFEAQAAKWVVVAFARTGAMLGTDGAAQIAACLPGQDYDPVRWQTELLGQCELIREFFGFVPFRSLVVSSTWRSPNIVQLAQAIYDERAFSRMPELAKALYDAGCNEHEVLHHCSWASDHARGCWVLDLLLGKE